MPRLSFLGAEKRYKRIVALRLAGWRAADIQADVGLSKAGLHMLIHLAVKNGDLPHAHAMRPPDPEAKAA